jgi:hypothetical protein
LWEIPAEAVLKTGWIGILPLVTLTDGGKQPEVVKEMIDRLVTAEEYDLLAISEVVGGLAFRKGPELEWFKRRFSMFQDILRESPIYQELVEQGREEERQQELQRQRQTLMSFIQRHFPEINALAKLQLDSVADPEFLQIVILKLLDCQTLEEARRILLNIDNGETKH